ncbi:MAG: MFS transporter [Steroidobacteraceae bacterium]
MGNPYRAIFKPRGAIGFAAAAFVARLPVAMAPIGIVTMLSQSRGEYALAGAVAATFTLANAVAAPQISRLADRLGQFRLLIPTTALSAVSFTMLMIAAHRRWPSWSLFVTAVFAALMPSISAMVRARWTELFRNRPQLNTAFAFESAADELVYIAGASLSVGLSVALFAEAGILVSTLLLTLGTAAFVLQRGTEPPLRRSELASRSAAILLRPVQLITAVMVFVGTIFATAEVCIVALTREWGNPDAASLVIGVYAAGSFLLGVILGGVKLRAGLHRQMLVAICVLLITTFPLLLANTVLVLTVTIFLSGIAVSPTFITAFGLVERRVPPAVLTEAITWVGTGIGIGMALGAFVSGWVVDTFGARNGFWLSVGAATAALSIVALGQRCLAETRAGPEASAQRAAAR